MNTLKTFVIQSYLCLDQDYTQLFSAIVFVFRSTRYVALYLWIIKNRRLKYYLARKFSNSADDGGCRYTRGSQRTASFWCLPRSRTVKRWSRSPATRSATRSRSFRGSRLWCVPMLLLRWRRCYDDAVNLSQTVVLSRYEFHRLPNVFHSTEWRGLVWRISLVTRIRQNKGREIIPGCSSPNLGAAKLKCLRPVVLPYYCCNTPSVPWHCWLDNMKGTRRVKTQLQESPEVLRQSLEDPA